MQPSSDRKTGFLVGVIAVLALALAVVAWTAYGPSGSHGQHAADMHGDHLAGDADADSAGFSEMDLMFAQMMIPHHQQAVTMSEYALTNSQDSKVLDLARRIKAAQGPEISQMRNWLLQAGVAEDLAQDHMMSMGGMLTSAELEALRAKQGGEFDKAFLAAMIEHHKGALDMASMIDGSANPEVRGLAEDIRRGQSAEISEMQALLGG